MIDVVHAYTGILLWVMHTYREFDLARESSLEARTKNNDAQSHLRHQTIDEWTRSFHHPKTKPSPTDMEALIKAVIPAIEDEVRLRKKYNVDDLPWARLEYHILNFFQQIVKGQLIEVLEEWLGVKEPSFGPYLHRMPSPENFDWRGQEAEDDGAPLEERDCGGDFERELDGIKEVCPSMLG